MKRVLVCLFCIFALLSYFRCNTNKNENKVQSDIQQYSDEVTDYEEVNRLTALEHEKAWEEAYKYRESITDSTFLQTKRPMSDDAIGPYNYQTGFKEDRAYNQVVYIAALDRAKKHLSVSGGKFILNLHSGQEINIAEDLFQYIDKLIEDWNGLIKIVKTEEGYYDIEPVVGDSSAYK